MIIDRNLRRAVVAGAIGTLIALSACGKAVVDSSKASTLDPSAIYGEADYIYHFDSLLDMVAASHLVVEGRAVSVDPGRTIVGGTNPDRAPTPGEHGVRQQAVVTLAVERVLFGSLPSSASGRVQFEQRWKEDGRPLIMDNVKPAAVGDTGIYFFRLSTHRVFELINNQSQYLVTTEGIRGSDPSDALVAELNALGLDAFRERVMDEAARVERGEVQRVP